MEQPAASTIIVPQAGASECSVTPAPPQGVYRHAGSAFAKCRRHNVALFSRSRDDDWTVYFAAAAEVAEEGELASPEVIEVQPDILSKELFGSDAESVAPLPWNELVAQKWLALVRKGLPEEDLKVLLKKYLPPDSSDFLRAPKLNPECEASLRTNPVVKRDSYICKIQDQAGIGLYSLGEALSDMLRPEVQPSLSSEARLALCKIRDAGKIMADLFFRISLHRRAQFTSVLNLVAKSTADALPADNFLFGSTFGEEIKKASSMQKCSKDIVRAAPSFSRKPLQSLQTSQTPSAKSGNSRAPPRSSRTTPRKPGAQNVRQKTTHRSRWKRITCDPVILEAIAGYRLPFRHVPPCQRSEPSVHLDNLEEQACANEIDRLIKEGAVEAVNDLPYGMLYTKILEREKFLALSEADDDFEARMSLPASIRDDLLWWKATLENDSQCNKIRSGRFEQEIYTDASLTGWGALTNIDILLRMDNSTAIAYINRMGSIRFPHLSDLARKIWLWCENRNIFIFASYIPSAQNVEADAESRTVSDETEWSLGQVFFEEIEAHFGRFDIDLFATHINAKCRRFVSWRPDPQRDSPELAEDFPGGREVIRQAFLNKGSSPAAVETMLASITAGTIAQYAKPLRLWWLFCRQNRIDHFSPPINSFLAFLSTVLSNSRSYASLVVASTPSSKQRPDDELATDTIQVAKGVNVPHKL
ncbi:uncharacterized protein [Cardiocondyla obscurior]|uniref:uncharacterized protein n=1 Tax=Cardiocondyla obscurior TaxID=286306 RepID=UPI00396586EB